jgi:hypothetical protein
MILKVQMTLKDQDCDITYTTEGMVETDEEARQLGITFAELYAAFAQGMDERTEAE